MVLRACAVPALVMAIVATCKGQGAAGTCNSDNSTQAECVETAVMQTVLLQQKLQLHASAELHQQILPACDSWSLWADGRRRRHWQGIWPKTGSKKCKLANRQLCFGNYITRPDKGGRCVGNPCEQEDENSECCCVERASCATMQCPSLSHIKNTTAEHNERCEGFNCEEIQADLATCCSARAACSPTACKAGHVLKLDAIDRRCHKTECATDDEDNAECCDPRAECNANSCGNGYFLKHVIKEAEPIGFCQGKECSLNEDQESCCFHVPQTCLNGCANPNMTAPAGCPDKDVMKKVCGQTATCASLTCPMHSIHKPNAEFILCQATDKCTEEDHATCCDVLDKCTNMKCPNNYFTAEESLGEYSYQQLRCAGPQCDLEADLDTCCVEAKTLLRKTQTDNYRDLIRRIQDNKEAQNAKWEKDLEWLHLVHKEFAAADQDLRDQLKDVSGFVNAELHERMEAENRKKREEEDAKLRMLENERQADEANIQASIDNRRILALCKEYVNSEFLSYIGNSGSSTRTAWNEFCYLGHTWYNKGKAKFGTDEGGRDMEAALRLVCSLNEPQFTQDSDANPHMSGC